MKKNLRENTKKIWHGISYPKQPELTWYDLQRKSSGFC